MVDELRKRSVVESISVSQVNLLLRQVDLQAAKRKTWCFTTEKDRETFDRQVQEVCYTFLNAQTAYQQHNTHPICVDEMTSLQANECRAADKLPLTGQSGKRECQYTRHGTLSFSGSWHVVLGQMIQTTIDVTRNDWDFANHIDQTIQMDPHANWVFLQDDLNIHSGEEVVRRIAQRLGIAEGTLADKAKRRGILGSTATRREFLSDPSHRIRFVYTPKHNSWQNQIARGAGSQQVRGTIWTRQPFF